MIKCIWSLKKKKAEVQPIAQKVKQGKDMNLRLVTWLFPGSQQTTGEDPKPEIASFFLPLSQIW